ncbi:MAG: glycosyltransferase [Desulfomicrobium sp.]|nr:glycosyltransferase [Desulfomicrobium sp.]
MHSNKTVLFLTARVPAPLDDGWKIRTFHLMQGYVRNGWRVDLLSYCQPEQEPGDFPELQALCRQLHLVPRTKAYSPMDLLRGLVLSTPFHVHNYHLQAMVDAVQEMATGQAYDLVQIEDVVMAQYVVPAMDNSLRILDMHNVESALLRRYAEKDGNLFKKIYARLTAAKLEGYERDVAGKFHKVLVCSVQDRGLLQDKTMSTPIQVTPNGVDCDYFQPLPMDPASKDLVFVGSMDYHANISGVLFFVHNILPLIHQKYPETHFTIVGKNPPEAIRRLTGERVAVTGMVPDVRPYLARARVVVVPLLVGGGTRLKILEAMACGKAIVSTPMGAEGISAKDSQHFCLADTAHEFAQVTIQLLQEPALCQRIGTAAATFVTERFDWRLITDDLCRSLSS